MTHELEAKFNTEFFDVEPLPRREPEEAAAVLVSLSRQHDFAFYKYQIPDLVSHTGRVELAREVFAVIERFVEAVLRGIEPRETVVVVTSDHGARDNGDHGADTDEGRGLRPRGRSGL